MVPNSFKSERVTKDNVKNEVQKSNEKKSSTFGCISVSILKDCVDFYLVHLINSPNHSLQVSVFSQKSNQAEAIPLYTKLDPLSKEIYRPENILPTYQRSLRG